MEPNYISILSGGKFAVRKAGSKETIVTDTLSGTISDGFSVCSDSNSNKAAVIELKEATAGSEGTGIAGTVALYLPIPGRHARELAVALIQAGQFGYPKYPRFRLSLRQNVLGVCYIDPNDEEHAIRFKDELEDLFDEDVIAQANGVIAGKVKVDFEEDFD